MGAIVAISNNDGDRQAATNGTMNPNNLNNGNGGGTQPPPEQMPEVDFFAELATVSSGVATSSVADSAGRTYLVSGSMLTLAGTDYTFTQTTSREPQIISSDNNLLLFRDAAENSGFTTFYVGTNLGQAGETQTFSAVDMVRFGDGTPARTPMANLPSDDMATANINEALVMYSGDFRIARVPTDGDINSGIDVGTFMLNIDFTQRLRTESPFGTSASPGGMAFMGATQVGTFYTADPGGRLEISPSTNSSFIGLRFDGSGALSEVQNVIISGGIVGDDFGEIVGVGRTMTADSNSNHATMGIVGEKQ